MQSFIDKEVKRKLDSVGIACFIKYFDIFQKHYDDYRNQEIINVFKENNEPWSDNACNTRASYGKAIFKENLVEVVLGYIANEANPNKIDEALIRRANDLLDRRKKENNISTFDTIIKSSNSQELSGNSTWYKDLVNNVNDGLIPLLSLFKNEKDFYTHYLSNVKFFKVEIVEKASRELLERIKNKEKIPVRYSLKSDDFFKFSNEFNQRGFSVKKFKNRKDAHDFSEQNILTHKETEINICIDKDGNYYVKKLIKDLTGLKVSAGSICDYVNYTISHVWGKTDNPLFFTSLWNIVLIPNYLSFILDKPDSSNIIVSNVKKMVKALCVEKYNPNHLMNSEIIDMNEIKEGEMLLHSIVNSDFKVSFI